MPAATFKLNNVTITHKMIKDQMKKNGANLMHNGNKIPVILACRQLTGAGLVDAKNFVEHPDHCCLWERPDTEKVNTVDVEYFDSDYVGCVIKDIRRGKTSEGRGDIVYANVYNAYGELLISADMDYIAHVLKSRCPRVP